MMLIDFLSDVTSHMDEFRDDIATLYVFQENDTVIATGNHDKMQILYRVEPLVPQLTDQIEAPAYIGALPYLRYLLGSTMMKEDPRRRLELSYLERGGEKIAVKSMRFESKKLHANFECTNPDIIDLSKRRTQFPKPPDAITFPLSKVLKKEFEEVARFNTPKADVRLFMLVYDGSYVRAIFGTGKHTTQLILTNDIGGHNGKFQKALYLDRFRSMLKLAADYEATAGFHPNAFWVEFKTTWALHTIVIPTVRESK